MSTPLSVKLGSLIDEFNLEVLRGAEGYRDLPISTEDINRPGLQLTGFFDYFDAQRIQVIGLVMGPMMLLYGVLIVWLLAMAVYYTVKLM